MSAVAEYVIFFGIAYAGYLLLFFVLGGTLHWLFYSGAWGDWRKYRIQPDRAPAPGQVRREILLSVVGYVFFALAATVVYGLYRAGLTQIYTDLSGAWWLYFAASVLMMLAVHETYFYWVHRLLHWKRLFRSVHRVHHLSLAPTPWGAYGSHPVESMMFSGNLLVYPLLFPVHPLAMVAFVLIQHAYSTFGHCGYDCFPQSFRRLWYLSWHNTPSHHDNHHRYTNGNYGHYVIFWDWLLGTEVPERQIAREPAQRPTVA